MSTPESLDIPAGVDVTTIETDRGPFAAHTAQGSRGHVLLIPGWTGSKEDFTPLLPYLAEAGFAATAYDQRGQFQTRGADDADYSLAGLALDAASVAAASGHPVSHILGHSFGGLVAQQAVVDLTDRWASLSLLCTGPGALGDSPRRQLDQLIEALASDLSMTEIARRLKGGEFNDPPEITDFIIAKFEGTSRVSLAAMTGHLQATPDLTDQIAALGIAAWVCRGVDDDAWPHASQDDQARRLGTTTVVIADSAHSPAIENPAGLGAALVQFLNDHC